MSYIIGANNNPLTNFTLSPGQSTRITWSGGDANYPVGFPFPSAVFTVAGRIVATENTMEWSSQVGGDGLLYGTNLRAESNGSGAAAFRMQLGKLS
ncbi:hypothetical protein [Mycobacterium sp. AZCC_0083]|jgi:hypothetical protein|uniref:hypothetical protein n=1 Tax=Mycobacterium sp. AZCC_0083 TaxID=2735882 RepID=UPI001609D347|nr:hypothetical protein [Mycobacterium sp. AZCC_0083]MBB5164387.1 hypothetical protein [Mycobacterium sp. AZCC_0083]